MKAIKIILLTTPSLLLPACQDWNYQRVSFLEVLTGEAATVTANTAELQGTLFGLIQIALTLGVSYWLARPAAPTRRPALDSPAAG